MKLVGNYKDDIKSLITGSLQYEPIDLNEFSETHLIKLSVFSNNINFEGDYILQKDVDYYYKDEWVSVDNLKVMAAFSRDNADGYISRRKT